MTDNPDRRDLGRRPEQHDEPARARRTTPRSAWLFVPSGALLLMLVAPLLMVLLRTLGSEELMARLSNSTVLEALRISLTTTLATLVLIVAAGTPTAYLLARYEFRGKKIIDTLIDLPMVLPPAVAGIALLITFGRTAPVGQLFDLAGLSLPFTTAAVVMAQFFVASPFYVRSAKAGFESVDIRLEQVSATLGASSWTTFLRVTLPLALPGLMSGAVMSWARALGEFGATIMFAGSFVGVTQTMPLAIYLALQDDVDTALAVATILILVSFTVLVAFRWLARRHLEAPLHA